MKVKRAAGCVVYRRDPGGALWLLLIRDRYGMWTIPKGHLEAGESDEQAAAREVFEETGIRGELGSLVSQIEYRVLSKKGQQRLKQVTFFLLHTTSAGLHLQADEGIEEAEWLAPADALARAGYPQIRDVLAHALAVML